MKKFITPEIIELLNFRINQEEYSSRLYEQMSLWLKNKGFIHSSKVWKNFSKEELEHAELAKDYILSMNEYPQLDVLEDPENNFTSLVDIINKSLEHEIKISEQCLELTNKAFELKDWNLFQLAQKYNEIQKHELEEYYDLVSMSYLTTDMVLLDNYIKEKYL